MTRPDPTLRAVGPGLSPCPKGPGAQSMQGLLKALHCLGFVGFPGILKVIQKAAERPLKCVLKAFETPLKDYAFERFQDH